MNPVAAIVAPFFLGLVADRYFATEKVLGVLHIQGGLVMLSVPQATGTPALFIGLLLLYNLCYMPTLGLANTLAFHHIESQEDDGCRRSGTPGEQRTDAEPWGTCTWEMSGLGLTSC